MKKFSLVPISLVLALLVAGCVSQSTANIVKTMDENPGTPEQDITLSAYIGGFEPREITVKKDVPVKITATVREIDPKYSSHGFSIKEFGVNENIPANGTTVIEFTPDKAGSFVFFCSVFCGQGHVGQAGILHVVE